MAIVTWPDPLRASQHLKNCPMPKLASCCLLPLLLFMLTACQFPGFSKKEAEEQLARKNPCIALALPASGPYVSFATKIRNGASVAARELQGQGINLTLRDINTEAPDWIRQLEALPASCAVVGGPLQNKTYAEARKAGLLEKKVFFSFAPTIQQGDEGKRAWRFFPGQQDQIDALVRFVTDDLNIRTFGAFYPTDSYGQRMVALLDKTLREKNISLQKASYNPGAPATWSAAAKQLINPVKKPGSDMPLPQTMFEALFVPDSWKNMDMITTSLLYNGEDRLVLMGTTAWEQSLAGKQVPRAGRYALAVFPGAFQREKAPSAIATKDNDFWNALGYDFVNFAVNLGILSRLEAGEVNARAQKASSVIRALAPMSWDNNGLAHQQLYLFQIGSQGIRPMNVAQFKQAREAISEQSTLRMQSVPETMQEAVEPVSSPEALEPDASNAVPYESGVTPGANTPQPAPAPRILPENQIMSPTPQPSYKLRLPSRS